MTIGHRRAGRRNAGAAAAGGPHLTVGMLTADLGHLGDDLGTIERAGVELVHVDVGDGAFSPMFTLGAAIVKAMRTPMSRTSTCWWTIPCRRSTRSSPPARTS